MHFSIIALSQQYLLFLSRRMLKCVRKFNTVMRGESQWKADSCAVKRFSTKGSRSRLRGEEWKIIRWCRLQQEIHCCLLKQRSINTFHSCHWNRFDRFQWSFLSWIRSKLVVQMGTGKWEEQKLQLRYSREIFRCNRKGETVCYGSRWN